MEPELYDTLDGQVALVTGANRGMGAVTAAALQERGATVYAGSRDPAAIAPDGPLRAVELDVTEVAQIERAIGRVAEETGRLDILVNNAGIAPGADQRLVDESLEQIDRVFEVNLRGPVAVTKLALPLLLETDGARVVNVSSGMGALGEGMSGGAAAYRLSKAPASTPSRSTSTGSTAPSSSPTPSARAGSGPTSAGRAPIRAPRRAPIRRSG